MAQTSGADDSQALYGHACELSAQGNHKAAAEALEHLLKDQGKSWPAHRDAICTMDKLAGEKFLLGDYTGAAATYRNQLAAQEKIDGPDSTWAIMYNLSGVLVKQGKTIEAEAILRRLLPLLQEREKNENENVFAQQELGTMRLLMEAVGRGTAEKNEEVEKLHVEALAIANGMNGEEREQELAALQVI